MSDSIPQRADLRQLRTQAKELLRAHQSGQSGSDSNLPANAKLSDAQRVIAQRNGFKSWPKLVEELEGPSLLAQFKGAMDRGDAVALEKLLRTKAQLRRQINDPMFSFGGQPIIAASHHSKGAELIPILIRYGADPNIRSDWWAGGFGALDFARGEAAERLLALGAKHDVWSASVHGRIDVLRELLDADPSLVNAPGGDGKAPLHFAGNAATAKFLIDRGADLEQRDVDHESTPIQHLVTEGEIVRVLLDHGAKADIFSAVALDDADLAQRILEEDPSAVDAAVGKAPFTTVKSDGGHTYTYQIGPAATPHAWAAKLGHQKVLEVLLRKTPLSRRLVVAAWLGDEPAVDAVLAMEPGIGQAMGADARSIADAAQSGKAETIRLLLKAGLDPTVPGMDSGTALHVACWFGYLEVVKLLIVHVPLDLTDAHHGSPPLGWALHGANYCRNGVGDYAGVVAALLAAGADPTAPANRNGDSMIAQAGQREDLKAMLRALGAK